MADAKSSRPESPEPRSAEELLPLVYDELRRLARFRMARERPQTLEPTALVHEAFLRLGGAQSKIWHHQGHFFAAAAQAMRRILIERARRYARDRHGGGRRRVTLEDEVASVNEGNAAEMLALDQALTRLEERDKTMAEVVKLRYFAGLTVPESAAALELSPRSVDRAWSGARTWLYREIERGREA